MRATWQSATDEPGISFPTGGVVCSLRSPFVPIPLRYARRIELIRLPPCGFSSPKNWGRIDFVSGTVLCAYKILEGVDQPRPRVAMRRYQPPSNSIPPQFLGRETHRDSWGGKYSPILKYYSLRMLLTQGVLPV